MTVLDWLTTKAVCSISTKQARILPRGHLADTQPVGQVAKCQGHHVLFTCRRFFVDRNYKWFL